MNEFNEAARIFATTPAEWQYSGREQDKFTGIKERYEKSLEGYIGVKRAHSKNDGEAQSARRKQTKRFTCTSF